MELTLFQQMALVLALAAGLGAIALFLRQPLLVAFIVVGIGAGPAGLGIVHSGEPFDTLAELGIALLLFLVGLRLDLQVIARMGPSAAIAGCAQVLVTAALGFGVALLCGLDPVPGLFVAVGLAFSSTVVVVKLLADKREIDSLHGRLAIGILIVQDLVVIVALIALPAVRHAGDGSGPGPLDAIVRGSGLLVSLGVLARFVLPRLLHAVARSPEALVLFGIAWALVVAAVAEWLGFGLELGAFLAGVCLASTRYRDAIGGRLTSVRDFLLLFFFVALGATVRLDSLSGHVSAAVALSLFVLVGKPLLVLVILLALGYGRRTGALAAISLAQISEFSLILCKLGVDLGQLSQGTLALVTVVGLATIVVSSLAIGSSQELYARMAPLLERIRLPAPRRELDGASDESCQVIVFGLGRYGANIASELASAGVRVLGADFDPEAVVAARRHGIDARYADVEDPEQVRNLPLGNVRCVVAAVPQRDLNRALWDSLRAAGYSGRIALTAHSHADELAFRRLGADHVFLPFLDAAKEAAERVTDIVAAPTRDA